ncbi:MAG: HD domain-containing phosphohydrolase [bacterium]
MPRLIHVLVVSDSEEDTLLIVHEIQCKGYQVVHRRVDAPEDMRNTLKNARWDIIILNYKMSNFSCMETLKLLGRENIDIPFIIVSYPAGQGTDINITREGTADYVIQGDLKRLVPVIEHEMREAEIHRARKAADKELHKTREQLQHLLSYSPPVIYSCKPSDDCEIKFVSENIFRQLGYHPKDFIDNPLFWVTHVHPCDAPTASFRKQKGVFIQNSKKEIQFEHQVQEYRFLHKDGTWRWLHDEQNLIHDKDGKPFEVIGCWTDVTRRKEAEEKIKQGFYKLKRILEETASALSSVLEKRDPYTAGHQQRVTKLACAIAQEIGLSEEQIEAVRIAGVLHDIGKISIPSDILSKPGKLTPIEFGLMKTHCQIGYEILKPIEFPWPVAQIVFQHHERINGGGYPNKLKEDKILLEAQIIGVADVVEAMASHRPYRPALGLDKALEEISDKKGIFYPALIVDACLKIFHDPEIKFNWN